MHLVVYLEVSLNSTIEELGEKNGRIIEMGVIASDWCLILWDHQRHIMNISQDCVLPGWKGNIYLWNPASHWPKVSPQLLNSSHSGLCMFEWVHLKHIPCWSIRPLQGGSWEICSSIDQCEYWQIKPPWILFLEWNRAGNERWNWKEKKWDRENCPTYSIFAILNSSLLVGFVQFIAFL